LEPDFVSQDGLISAAVLANRARRPAQGLTEDWIRQHTGGESTERSNWLSDGPGDSEHSSLSGSISGDGDWLGQETDPRTPTLKSYRLSIGKGREEGAQALPRRNSTETLKQADFTSPAHPTMSTADDNAVTGAQMGNENSAPAEEAAPPVPPKELPEWRAAALPAVGPGAPATPAPSVSPAPVPPRLKKKVPWKGKNILVLLPWDDARGKSDKAPPPLTQKEVDAMLKEWEDLGYDTRGFTLGPSESVGEGNEGQSRHMWPLLEDVRQERAQRAFRVSIPDRRGKLYFLEYLSVPINHAWTKPMLRTNLSCRHDWDIYLRNSYFHASGPLL
jgi:hypothetical protein